MDLIDIHLEKDDIFHWILHIKDHFSKYSFLWPLTDKGARQVVFPIICYILLTNK